MSLLDFSAAQVQDSKMTDFTRTAPAQRDADYVLKFSTRKSNRKPQGQDQVVESTIDQFYIAPNKMKDWKMKDRGLLYVVLGGVVHVIVTDNADAKMALTNPKAKNKSNRFISSAFHKALQEAGVLPTEGEMFEQKFALKEIGTDQDIKLPGGVEIKGYHVFTVEKDGEPYPANVRSKEEDEAEEAQDSIETPEANQVEVPAEAEKAVEAGEDFDKLDI